MDTHVQSVGNSGAVSMLLLASELPFQTVDDALNACLEDIDRDADGSPAILSIGKDAQDTNQRAGAMLIVFLRRLVRQQPNVELFQLDFRELREMFFKDFAHGVIDRVNRAAPARGDELLFAENFDQNGSLG
jgi:hypothetical protein